MASLNDLLRLLAETESRLTRETEAILAGEADGTVDPDRKSAVIDRLLAATPAAGHLAHAASADDRQQLRDGFERMLDAAARNEMVLRGALRGARLISSAIREVSETYPGAQQSGDTGKPKAIDAGVGHYNRLA